MCSLQAEKANSAKQTQLQLLNRANTMKNLTTSAGNSIDGSSSNDVNSIQQVSTISDDEKFKQVMKIADNEIQVSGIAYGLCFTIYIIYIKCMLQGYEQRLHHMRSSVFMCLLSHV
jgi:exoribonuclease II